MSLPTFAELIADCQRSAVHLELRDVYYSNPLFEAWKQGYAVDWTDRDSWWLDFHDRITAARARGVVVRRARVVSEPLTDYIRWEHEVTRANVAAGEKVRWLPRRQTTDMSLPGNDFWLFDDEVLRIHHFAGNGDHVEDEIVRDHALARHCGDAFEAVWQRAIPHENYTPPPATS